MTMLNMYLKFTETSKNWVLAAAILLSITSTFFLFPEKHTIRNWLNEVSLELLGEERNDLAYLTLDLSARLDSYWAQEMLIRMYNYDQRERAEKWIPIVAERDPDFILLSAQAALFHANYEEDYQYVKMCLLHVIAQGKGEAALIMGYITIDQQKMGCSSLPESFSWFYTAATLGNDRAKVLMAVAFGANMTELIERERAYHYLENTSHSDDQFASMFATFYLENFIIFHEGKRYWAPIPNAFRKYLPDVIELYMNSTVEFNESLAWQKLERCINSY